MLDQFIRDKTNKRTDIYGGSIENRARLLLEVIAAVTTAWAPERTGVRLAPVSPHIDIADSQPMQTFSYIGATVKSF